ncbi:uncharacterized protein BJ171DRAFT_495637 [Polychytrium aggregatum]|uniref:uncharacterized protein n=1 Tax=Polychytrium aggregatum TaxID=110093 RepID=UPI0022FEB4E5|nr:uncharacterized protein BJ171DRAFT_495637 [Polychytrium aggregatum]KAI9207094.1 hypothetical protein BJ171DRAFT_495637 [Polychytrium aggregatum]
MWEEKLQRQEATHQKKMQALDESKDVEMNERVRKLEERIRQLEHDKTQADQNFDSMKAKLVSEKRHLLDQMSEAESRHQRDEELKRKELEEQIEYLKHQNAQLQQTLTTQINTYNQSLLDRETENKRHQDLRIQLQEQLADMKAQLTTVQSELGHMRQRCEDARRSEHSQQENIAALNTQMLKLREDHGKVELNLQMQIEKLTALMNQKDLLIARLKDEIRKREDELDEIEEGQALKMKELQVSIGSLLSARGRRPRKASPSLEPS